MSCSRQARPPCENSCAQCICHFTCKNWCISLCLYNSSNTWSGRAFPGPVNLVDPLQTLQVPK